MRVPIWLMALLAVWGLALHGALAAALLYPDAIWRRWHRVWPGRAEETVSPFRRNTMALQARLDLTVQPRAVWVFGDSHVQAMDIGRIAERAVNLGIGEDTVPGLLSRIGTHPALPGAAGVVLAVGINDLAFRGPEAIAASYADLLARLPAGMPAVIGAVLPVNERVRPGGLNARIGRLNAALADLCRARPHCRFADAGPRLRDATGAPDPQMYLADGLHLSAEGYRRWIEVLGPAVREGIPP